MIAGMAMLRRAPRLAQVADVAAFWPRTATNACLDSLRSRRRRVPSLHSMAELPWLQPYPDRLLDELTPSRTRWSWPGRRSS